MSCTIIYRIFKLLALLRGLDHNFLIAALDTDECLFTCVFLNYSFINF